MNTFHCDLCEELFNPVQRRPKCLPCGHTVCLCCLERYSKTNELAGTMCPFDRKIFLEPPQDTTDNWYLIRRMENSSSDAEVPSLPRVPGDYWCTDCNAEVMEACVTGSGHRQVALRYERRAKDQERREALRRLVSLQDEERRLLVSVAERALLPLLLPGVGDVDPEELLDSLKCDIQSSQPAGDGDGPALNFQGVIPELRRVISNLECAGAGPHVDKQQKELRLSAAARALLPLLSKARKPVDPNEDDPEEVLLLDMEGAERDTQAEWEKAVRKVDLAVERNRNALADLHQRVDTLRGFVNTLGIPAAATTTVWGPGADGSQGRLRELLENLVRPILNHPVLNSLDVYDHLDRTDPDHRQRIKANLLGQRFQRLVGVRWDEDPAWVLQLLRRNSPYLLELELMPSTPEQLMTLSSMSGLEVLSLQFAEATGDTILETNRLLLSAPRISMLRRLVVLNCDGLHVETVYSLLVAFRSTLTEVELGTKRDPASIMEPREGGPRRLLRPNSTLLLNLYCGEDDRPLGHCISHLGTVQNLLPSVTVRCTKLG